MTPKEFLQQAFIAHREIEIRLEQITKLQSLAAKTTTVINPAAVRSNSPESKIENAVILIQEYMTKLAAEITRLVEVTGEITGAIDNVVNVDERAVLEYRYLCFYSWQEISLKMNTSVDNVWKLHRRAMKNFRVTNSSRFQ